MRDGRAISRIGCIRGRAIVLSFNVDEREKNIYESI